ncbi:unnamed protein product [Hymenolepis diminuta]|uniref:5'-nucleotidase n=1 Tax=Hymenolepis diminuta TaxID=6216 RepID=A0A564Y176_HYMDI|nr:unnamed protein product [Hymenolepis diminuta]
MPRQFKGQSPALTFISKLGACYFSRFCHQFLQGLLMRTYSSMQNLNISTHSCSRFTEPGKPLMNILFKSLFEQNNKVSSYFYIKYPDRVRRKLSRMIHHGHENLQIISDFDWTLSRAVTKEGELNATCHGIFERDPEITNEARTKLRMLKQTYGSVEFDKNIPNSFKIPYMLEWWDISHRVIVSCDIHKSTLRSTVYNSNLQLRDRVPEFMAELHKHKIPVVVFSAGLGNVIELVLEKEGLLYNNVKVASNFMNFNEEGLLVSFQSSVIHTFNKAFGSLALSEEDRKLFAKKRCVMLLGDSLYDQHMADGLVEDNSHEDVSDEESSVVLKIGFLNGKVSF